MTFEEFKTTVNKEFPEFKFDFESEDNEFYATIKFNNSGVNDILQIIYSVNVFIIDLYIDHNLYSVSANSLLETKAKFITRLQDINNFINNIFTKLGKVNTMEEEDGNTWFGP